LFRGCAAQTVRYGKAAKARADDDNMMTW
jgi:hypothetical protein